MSKPRITYAEFMDMRQRRLFIYEGYQDFRNDWVYHHWALLGHNAGPAIWGI